MVHPVFGICFALCAGSIQTAVSQAVASNVERGRAAFKAGLVISLTMAVFLGCIIWNFGDFLAVNLLMEERCAPLLPFVAVSVPCSAIHACINGYYYGLQKTKVPAFSQLAEQLVRIGVVFLLAGIMAEKGIVITVQPVSYTHLNKSSLIFLSPFMAASFSAVCKQAVICPGVILNLFAILRRKL